MNKLLIIFLTVSLFSCNTADNNKTKIKSFNNQNSYSDFNISHEDSILLIQFNSDIRHAILIKGKIENSTITSWLVKNDGYLGHQNYEIVIQPDGTFRQIVPIEGLTNLYLMLNNDAININVEPNDIIVLNWNEKDFENTFYVGSPDKYTNNNLNFNLQLYKKFRNDEILLHQRINEDGTGSKDKTHHEINDLFNSELAEINIFEANRDLFFHKIYFKFQGYLLDAKLLGDYKLQLNKVNSEDKTLQQYLTSISSNKFLSNQLFYKCPEYREFLYQYIISDKLFDDVRILHSEEMRNSKGELMEIPYTQTNFYDSENDKASSDFLLTAYLKAFSQIGISSIRDWYITYFLINSFKSQSFNKVETIYNEFLGKCQTPVYRDSLISTFQYYKKMNSGIKAPEFTLRNDKGQLVSLSDFKGKVVYLDFWGISCKPCLQDIKTYIPELHEKYKNKDVVFINVCVDSNESKWKVSLNSLKMDGVNLIAEGFTTNKVCIDYKIDAIPRYLIVDREGCLTSTNAPRPSELLSSELNIIDNLLINNTTGGNTQFNKLLGK
jgi:thiol-disulfide isomerase/thioredoxin